VEHEAGHVERVEVEPFAERGCVFESWKRLTGFLLEQFEHDSRQFLTIHG